MQMERFQIPTNRIAHTHVIVRCELNFYSLHNNDVRIRCSDVNKLKER